MQGAEPCNPVRSREQLFPNHDAIGENRRKRRAGVAAQRFAPAGGTRVKANLDAIDWNILKELQDDGRITNVELARRVGISAPPCLRRMRGLEEAGIVTGYRALVDEKALGFDVTVFAMVGLSSQAEVDLNAFASRVKDWAVVRECYMLSGEADFILKCVAPTLRAFQGFIEELTGAANVASVKTSLTIRRIKDEPIVPIA